MGKKQQQKAIIFLDENSQYCIDVISFKLILHIRLNHNELLFLWVLKGERLAISDEYIYI